jgi:hypothetical protein
MEREGSLL